MLNIFERQDDNFIKNGATDYILNLLNSINNGDIEEAISIIDNKEKRATEYQFKSNETPEEERERIRKLQEEEIKQRREKFLQDFYKK